MLKFTSIVGYTSCGPTYIKSFFFTIFGQCINVLNYKLAYEQKLYKKKGTAYTCMPVSTVILLEFFLSFRFNE